MNRNSARVCSVYPSAISVAVFILIFALAIHLSQAVAGELNYDDCLLEALKNADSDTTVAELRERCRKSSETDTPAQTVKPEPTYIEKRVRKEAESNDNPFAITAHKQNYVLPFAYNSSTNSDPYSLDWDSLKETEIKFQISLKYKLFDNLIKDNGDFYLAYTSLSLWQAYNKGLSSPFRETNYEPEVWLQFETDWELWGVHNRMISIGASHQSNGRSGSLSRSWNRLYLNFLFEKGDFAFSLKPWWRVPEEEKDTPDDSTGDDNPDIDKYMGYGEFGMLYKWCDNDFTLLFRNNLRTSDNMGAIQLGWSFPLYKKLKGYVQYFNGYGETLIDYNASTNRISVGLLLTDWL